MTFRAASLSALLLALLVADARATDPGITGHVTADVPNNTVLASGQTVHVTLAYTTTYPLLQVYVNVEGLDYTSASPTPTSVTPLKRGETTIGSSVLWTLDGSSNGSVTVTCTANPSFTAVTNFTGASGGVNSGNGAGGGGLVRTNLVSFRYAAPNDFAVGLQATPAPAPAAAGTLGAGSTVHYVVTGTSNVSASTITLTDTLPDHVTLLPKSVDPAATVDGRTLVWTFTGKSSVEASFDVKVDAADKIPDTVDSLTDTLHGEATFAAGPALTDDAQNALRLTDGTVDVALVDANPYFLPDVMVPDPNAPKALAARDWAGRYTRVVSRVAAEGVSLLLLRTKVDALRATSVRFELLADPSGTTSQGGLAQVTDTSLIDSSAEGGARDATGDGAQTLTATIQAEGQDHYAYALYRSPRNFDGTDLAFTAVRNSRNVTLRAQALDKKGKALRAFEDQTIVVARPLVILQHGTFDSPRGWLQFPLWTQSGNEYGNFSLPPLGLPFQVARTSFELVDRAAGRAIPSANVALQDLHVRLVNWAGATDTAAAQADVVTHSYGGVVMRLVAQGAVSTDPGNPLTAEQNNFRSARNWGHGMMHKLITIACTHRGSETGNHLAVLNHGGLIPGLIRHFASEEGSAIDLGAVEDQMVLSPLLRTLAETHVPCHAIVGSGLPEFNSNYEKRFAKVAMADNPGGPYKGAGDLYNLPFTPFETPNFPNFRRLVNFAFDFDYATLRDDVLQDPNYDLTVSSFSMKGLMPRIAYSDHTDLEALAGLAPGSLVGRLTHGDEISIGASGDPTPMNAVALRVVDLLRSPTTSTKFAHFPAASTVAPTALETTFSDQVFFNPAWLYETFPPIFKSATAAPSGDPELAAPSVGTVVAPGQSFDVTLTWPGETVDRGFVVWSAGGPDEETFLALAPGASGFRVTVSPRRQPGPFEVSAVLVGASGVTAQAKLTLRVEDAAGYVAVQMRPGGLYINTVDPVRIAVEGRLASGDWQDVVRSSHTTLTSSEPTVATVSADGVVQAVGIGVTTVGATLEGVGTAEMQVVVAGEEVRVSAVPRKKKPPKIGHTSKKVLSFAFLSSPTFDATRIDTATALVNGFAATKVAQKDVDHDHRPDLVVSIRASDLLLQPGAQSISLLAVTVGGTAVAGNVPVVVK